MCFSVSVIGFSMRNMLWINLVWGVGDFSGSAKLYVYGLLPSKKGNEAVICCLVKKGNEAVIIWCWWNVYVCRYKNWAGRATFVSLGMLLLSPQSLSRGLHAVAFQPGLGMITIFIF